MARKTITAEELEAEANAAPDMPPEFGEAPVIPTIPVQAPLDMTRLDNIAAAQEPLPPPGPPVHPCGLPEHFLAPRIGKGRIIQYVGQYGYSDADRMALEITEAERQLYQKYRHALGASAGAMDFFVAALRMWRSGQFPDRRPALRDLRALKIETMP